MTCPSFSDRDAALREQMMGPPTAQEHLRRSMRRDDDFLSAGTVYQSQIMPPPPIEDPSIKSRTPIWLWMIAVPLSLVALISIARGVM